MTGNNCVRVCAVVVSMLGGGATSCGGVWYLKEMNVGVRCPPIWGGGDNVHVMCLLSLIFC